MELEFKPDFERTRRYWDCFWEGEIIDRPCVHMTVRKEGQPKRPHPGQLTSPEASIPAAVEMYGRWAETMWFGGEAVPFFTPSIGPDQFSAFLGAKLHWSESSASTSWSDPFVDDWDGVLPLKVHQEGDPWKKIMKFLTCAAEAGEGRFLVGMLDLHSNLDCLVAIRGPERLCIDMVERPETVDRAVQSVRALFPVVYEAVFEAGRMAERGSIGWTPFYTRGKFATIQCDYICMLSPEMARRFVIPALEEEAAYLDHCVYHLDGPDSLRHLDDLLAIPDIDVIQWVPGAGQKPMCDWLDVLHRCQNAGKGLQVYGCNAEQVKALHGELRPEKVLYCVGVSSIKEGEDLLSWLRAHT